MAPLLCSFSAVPEEADETSLLDLLPGTVSSNPAAYSASFSEGGAPKSGNHRRQGFEHRPASRAGAAAAITPSFHQTSQVAAVLTATRGGVRESCGSKPPSLTEGTWEDFANSSARDRKQGHRPVSALSIRSENDTVLQRIAPFFDTRGLLLDQTPQHWALSLCNTQPLHGVEGVDQQTRRRDTITKRMREKNAREALERNSARTRWRIQSSIERQTSQRTVHFLDAQKSRQIVLLFSPIVQMIEEIPHDIIADILDEAGPMLSKEAMAHRRSSGEIDFSGKKLHTMAGSSTPRKMEQVQKESAQAPDGQNKGGFANDQRVILLTVFQSYVRRVTAKGELEMMQRCTWFRFLHHCGLLGKFGCGGGGVSFAEGSKVFDLHADAQLSPPMLTFSCWIEAVKHLVGSMTHRPPPKTNKDMLEYITGSLLTRCEARLKGACLEPQECQGYGGEPTLLVGARSTPRGQQRVKPGRRRTSQASSGSTTPNDHRTNSVIGRKRHMWSPVSSPWPGGSATISAASAQAAGTHTSLTSMVGAPFFQSLNQVKEVVTKGIVPRDLKSDIAEEQMCEPEVLQLLHEFEHPLRLLFLHYAGRASIGPCRCPIHAKVQRPRDETLQPTDSEKHFALTTSMLLAPPPINDNADTESEGMSPIHNFIPSLLIAAVGEDVAATSEVPDCGSKPVSVASVDSYAGVAAQASCDMERQASDQSACMSEGGRNVATFSKADSSSVAAEAFGKCEGRHEVAQNCTQPAPTAVSQSKEVAFTEATLRHLEQHEVAAKPEVSGTPKLGPSIVQRMGEVRSSQGEAMLPQTDMPPRMTEGSFLEFLKDFGIYPAMVQQHTAELHIRQTLRRRGTSKLTFTAFVETLCRIAFVYLSIYGNGVQQMSTSKRKCLWLLMMLRLRCRRFGEKLCLAPSLVAGPDDGPSQAWTARQAVDIEDVPLQELLLFRLLDAPLDSRPVSPRPREVRAKDAGKKPYGKSATFDSPTSDDI